MLLSFPFTFSTGQTILASSHNSNNNQIATVINGNLNSDNMTTITGTFTWNVSGASTLCHSIATSATEGAAKYTLTGVLAASKSGLWLTTAAAQTTGDALFHLQMTDSGCTIPAILIKYAGTTTNKAFRINDGSNVELFSVSASGVHDRRNRATKTANYTALTTDYLIDCDSSGGTFTVTLYAAANNAGRRLLIRKTDSSFTAVTIDGNGAETVGGSATTTLNTQNEAVELFCDGSNWQIIHRHTNFVKTWTPTLYATTSNPTIGTGSSAQSAIGYRVGRWFIINFEFRFGTGGGVNAGSGNYYVSLSDIGLTVDSNYMAGFCFTGPAVLYDDSVATSRSCVGEWVYSGGDRIYMLTDGGGQVTHNNPFVVASSDWLSWQVRLPITGWND